MDQQPTSSGHPSMEPVHDRADGPVQLQVKEGADAGLPMRQLGHPDGELLDPAAGYQPVHSFLHRCPGYAEDGGHFADRPPRILAQQRQQLPVGALQRRWVFAKAV